MGINIRLIYIAMWHLLLVSGADTSCYTTTRVAPQLLLLFNSCCVNFYEEDFLLLFSSLWLLPGFPAATSAKQIRLHLKGNMLALKVL